MQGKVIQKDSKDGFSRASKGARVAQSILKSEKAGKFQSQPKCMISRFRELETRRCPLPPSNHCLPLHDSDHSRPMNGSAMFELLRGILRDETYGPGSEKPLSGYPGLHCTRRSSR